MLVYILGKVLLIEGALMVLPVVCGLIYGETQVLIYIALAAIYVGLGYVISMKKPKNMTIFIKDGFVATALSWAVLSVCGCIPFVLTKEIPSFTDAMFETASGFTTTGASILTNVEAMSHTSLMWRSLTHWIGGMGVLVFLLAVVPMTGGSNMNLMRAESPGPSVGKIVPKVRSTAKMLYLIYLALTVAEILILFVCGMPLFDSICSAFGTAGTGGFGVRNDSFTSYAPHIQWIVAVFMIMFGVNFNFYYYLTTRQITKAFKMSEIRTFLIVIAVTTGIICFSVRNLYGSFEEALRHSFFQVSTIITTTGFATTDFDLWPSIAKSAETDYVKFEGSYAPIVYESADNTVLYLSDDNTLYYPDGGLTIGAFRARFSLLNDLTAGDIETNTAIRSFVLNFGGESTGIKDIIVSSGQSDSLGNWYTIDGRRLNGTPTQRGIYIRNGRKFIIK